MIISLFVSELALGAGKSTQVRNTQGYRQLVPFIPHLAKMGQTLSVVSCSSVLVFYLSQILDPCLRDSILLALRNLLEHAGSCHRHSFGSWYRYERRNAKAGQGMVSLEPLLLA